MPVGPPMCLCLPCVIYRPSSITYHLPSSHIIIIIIIIHNPSASSIIIIIIPIVHRKSPSWSETVPKSNPVQSVPGLTEC